MKIKMILTNGFDPDVRVYKEAKYLVRKGHNVEILCWDRKCDYQDKLQEEIDGIQIKRFGIPSTPGSGMKQLIPFLKFIKQVKKYLKNKKYDYLHCHDFDGIIVGLSINKKVVFDMHEIYKNYSYAKNPVFDFCFSRILKKSNYIIYVNQEQIVNLKSDIKEKAIYLPNYPEESIYNPIQKTKYNKIRVNYIGSLRDYHSLDSLAKVGIKNIDTEIGLYGMGVCYEELNKVYKNTKVKVHGKYNGISESGEIYRKTDILYCSYNPEVKNWKKAYPVKLFEAIITNTPIIVSENTDVANFIKNTGIGLAIKYGNVESIEKAIYDIKENYSYYVENIKKISENYKWEAVIKNLDKIYF